MPRNPPVREPRNRVVQVRCFGGPDGLEVVDAPLPQAGRGEVRVRMLASGLGDTCGGPPREAFRRYRKLERLV